MWKDGRGEERKSKKKKNTGEIFFFLYSGAGALSVMMKPPKNLNLGDDSWMHIHLIYEGEVDRNRRLPDVWEVVVIIEA